MPKVPSVHRDVKMMANPLCFLTPGLDILLSARCGVTAAPQGQGWKVRHLTDSIWSKCLLWATLQFTAEQSCSNTE